jgi:LysM repeat protein
MRHRPQIILLAATIALAGISAPFAGSAAAADRWITVRPGDTLSGIAARHGVTVAQLVRLNDLADPNRVYAGQRLRLLPAPSTRSAGGARGGDAGVAKRYRVVYGDTLSGIALRHGVTVTAIARANGIANVSFIRAGQVLRIPGGGRGDRPRSRQGRAERPRSYAIHRVGSGETLWGIAARYGSSVSAIAEANRITDPSFIRAGQELRIPGARGASGARRDARGGGRGAGGGSGGGALGGPTAAMPADMAAVVAERRSIGRIIVAEARRQGVPPAFALAVAWQESGWQPRVVSYAGAIGVMQLLPTTGDWVSAAMLGRAVNLWEPRQNVLAGVRLLKHYLVRYGGDRTLVLAAYYQGQSAADRYGVFPVSRPYIASILRLQQLFAG